MARKLELSSDGGSSIIETPPQKKKRKRKKRKKSQKDGGAPDTEVIQIEEGVGQMELIDVGADANPGSLASPTTLSIFKHLLFGFGIVTSLIGAALLTLDCKEMCTAGPGKTGKLSCSYQGNFCLAGAMGLNTCALIGHWYSPRAIYIALQFIESALLLLARESYAPRYHFELMWIVLVSMAVSGLYLYTIWMDGTARNEGLCTTLLKLQTGEDVTIEGQGVVFGGEVAAMGAMPDPGQAIAGGPPQVGMAPYQMLSLNRGKLLDTAAAGSTETGKEDLETEARKKKKERKKRSKSKKSRKTLADDSEDGSTKKKSKKPSRSSSRKKRSSAKKTPIEETKSTLGDAPSSSLA